MSAARIAILSLVLALIAALPLRAETLADALADAYRHSGLLEQNRALLRAADEDVAQAVAAMRPVVTYAAGANYSSVLQTTSANLDISANIVLMDFGRSQLRVDMARENVLSMREALIGVEQGVLLRAVAAYTSVRRDAAIAALRDNNVRVIGQQLRAAQDRFEVGEITRTDVAIAEARLASARSLQAAAQGNLARSREEYRAAVGHYPGNLAQPPAPPAIPASLEAARSIARERHPDMRQIQHGVTLSEINVALAKKAFLPTVGGNAFVSRTDGGGEARGFGLSVTGPIYQGGALASGVRKAVAQVEANRAALHTTRHVIDQNVSNAWSQLQVANAGLRATDEQIRAARVAFDGVREEADLGARTTLDVLDAEQELLDAEAGKVSAESDRYVAVYSLLSSMGLLTVEHLRLGIATYDPEAYYNAVKGAPPNAVSPQGERLDRVLKSIGKN